MADEFEDDTKLSDFYRNYLFRPRPRRRGELTWAAVSGQPGQQEAAPRHNAPDMTDEEEPSPLSAELHLCSAANQ
jgi:hypothetical protein